MSYTIDLTEQDDGWHWRLYVRGGTEFLTDGTADSLEQASSDARMAMIVAHRAGSSA